MVFFYSKASLLSLYKINKLDVSLCALPLGTLRMQSMQRYRLKTLKHVFVKDYIDTSKSSGLFIQFGIDANFKN